MNIQIKKNKEYTEELVSKIHTLYKGVALVGDDIIRYDEYIEIISYNCKVTGFDDLVPGKKSFISSIFLPEYNVKNISDFYKKGEELLKKRIDPKEVSILFRAHMDSISFAKIIEETEFLKNTIILSKNEYLTILNNSHNVKVQNRNNTSFWEYVNEGTWCKFSIKEKNYRTASIAAVNRIELFRAIINFVLNRKRIHVQSNPVQLSDISPSKYFFEIYRDNIAFWKIPIGNFKFKDKNITELECSSIISFMNSIDCLRKTNLKEDVLSSLFIYNEAIDSDRFDYSFILLWSIIDILIPQIDKNEKLLKSLYVKGKQKQSNIIDMLHDKRNRFVHGGKFNLLGLSDVNHLKSIIEDLIVFACSLNDVAENSFDIAKILSKIVKKNEVDHEIKLLKYVKDLK